jgi:hypothetical protein
MTRDAKACGNKSLKPEGGGKESPLEGEGA